MSEEELLQQYARAVQAYVWVETCWQSLSYTFPPRPLSYVARVVSFNTEQPLCEAQALTVSGAMHKLLERHPYWGATATAATPAATDG